MKIFHWFWLGLKSFADSGFIGMILVAAAFFGIYQLSVLAAYIFIILAFILILGYLESQKTNDKRH